MSYNIKSFEAKLHTPMFFSSKEGELIETDDYISTTALSHAIGYKYGDLEKPYIMIGDEAVNSDYSHLKSLPFLISDAQPIDVSVSERTFRSTTYTSERNITTTDESVAGMMGNSKGVPQKAGKSMSGWHKVREYVGAKPGSKYQFTIFGKAENIPDKIRFRIGIGRSGEITANKTENPEKVTINKFLLDNVHNLDNDQFMDIMANCEFYEEGSDPRLHRFVNVNIDYLCEEVLPSIDI